jgi:hypothetical protein
MGFPLDGIRTIVQSVAATVASLAGQAVSMLSLTLTQVSGQNALNMTTGARLKLGGGTQDFLTSDGSLTVSSNGNFNANGGQLQLAGLTSIIGGFLASGDTAVRGNIANGATSIAVKVANNPALTTAGAQIMGWYQDNGSTQVAAVDQAGRFLNVSPGNSTGAPGAATLNTPSGRSAIAAAASSCVITNSLVSATTIVLVVLMTNDGTALLKNVVPGAGSFTVTLNAAATGNTNFGWVLWNV